MSGGFEDYLIVGFDCFELPTISVGRKTKKGMEIINTIMGDKAKLLYDLITGKVETE